MLHAIEQSVVEVQASHTPRILDRTAPVTRRYKDLLFLQDTLEKLILRVDLVETYGSLFVRGRRKHVVHVAQSGLDKFDNLRETLERDAKKKEEERRQALAAKQQLEMEDTIVQEMDGIVEEEDGAESVVMEEAEEGEEVQRMLEDVEVDVKMNDCPQNRCWSTSSWQRNSPRSTPASSPRSSPVPDEVEASRDVSVATLIDEVEIARIRLATKLRCLIARARQEKTDLVRIKDLEKMLKAVGTSPMKKTRGGKQASSSRV